MSFELREFLATSLGDPASCWSRAGLRRLAGLRVPDRIFCDAGDMLRGDVHRQWAEWFVGTICDVDCYVRAGAAYPRIYGDVRTYVAEELSELRASDGIELARDVARLVHAEVKRRAEAYSRVPMPLPARRLLVDLPERGPYCWICGWRFGKQSVEAFLGESHESPIELPPLLDVYKPIGLSRRHLRIEVDHVVARSRGGSDEATNLRLCCGWCNIHKAARASIYDVTADSRPAGPGRARRGLPQPFWVVRLLALEAQGGGLSPADCELTVALRNPKGALNPSNLRVVTYADDPMGPDRFQGRDKVARMWRHIEE